MGYSQNPATGFPGFLALFAPSYTLNIVKQINEQKRANFELAAAQAEDQSVRLKETIDSQQHRLKHYHLNRELSQRGIQSYFETLQSKVELDKKNIAVNRAKLQSLLTVIKVYQELGSGYEAW